MQDAREILLIIRGRDTGLESLPFPLKWLLDHGQEIEFPDGCSLPVSDLIYFETDYDILLWKKPRPLDYYHVPASEIIAEGIGGVCTLSEISLTELGHTINCEINPLALPKYVRIGSPTGTALRLQLSDHSIKRKYTYWRDAGLWGVAVIQKMDGKFYTVDKEMPWLNDLELFPISHEEYAEDNKGYYSMKDSDYKETEDDDDDIIPY